MALDSISMKKIILALFGFSIAFLIISCEPEEEKISGSGGINLLFSTDTVIFDTLLSSRTSITKRLRIFNPSKNAVSISSIRLGKGTSSSYSIIANGKFGDRIEDETLFGRDSLLVLVDVEIDPMDKNLPYIVKDSIVVDWNGKSAHIKLVAWGQDANFINGEIVCDETWTAERPYVIYNGILVDSLCTLTIEKGSRIYIDNGASFFIKGTLKVKGDSGNHVVFRNTRFDGDYGRSAPGQWDAIYFLEGSKNNEIEYADIENGVIGLRIGSPDDDEEFDVVVRNTSIRHMSLYGIQSLTSDVFLSNTEVYNCGIGLVASVLGGNYLYEHCTFSNFRSDFLDDNPKFQVADNVELTTGEVLSSDLNFTMKNSIVWGGNEEELYINILGESNISIELDHNIIRSTLDLGTGNFTSQEDNFPGFVAPVEFDYQLDSLSFARDKGANLEVEFDILGMPRDIMPDIGAYERIDN